RTRRASASFTASSSAPRSVPSTFLTSISDPRTSMVAGESSSASSTTGRVTGGAFRKGWDGRRRGRRRNRRQPTALSAMRSHRSRAEMTRSTRRRTTILVPQLLSHYGRSNRSNDGGTQLLLRQRLPERFDHFSHATRSAVSRHRESSRHPRRIFLRHAMSTVKQFCHNPEQILDVLGDGAK